MRFSLAEPIKSAVNNERSVNIESEKVVIVPRKLDDWEKARLQKFEIMSKIHLSVGYKNFPRK